MIDFGAIVALLRDTKWTASLQAVTVAVAAACGASGALAWMVVSLIIGAVVTIAGSQKDNKNAKAAAPDGGPPSSPRRVAAFFLPLALVPFLGGCAGLFGPPDAIKAAWADYEVLTRAAIVREEARETRELEIFGLLQPADEEARIEKARMQAEIDADNARAAEERVLRLELLRAVAGWANAPGLFGSPEAQARADERLIGLIRAVKGGS